MPRRLRQAMGLLAVYRLRTWCPVQGLHGKLVMVWWNNLRLKSKDPETRRKAIESLDLEAGLDPQKFELLAACLRDEDAQVRGAAAIALGGYKDPRAVELLIPLLSDSNAET